MTAADPVLELLKASDHLDTLQQQTPGLEAALEGETGQLATLRREARDGTATLAQVATQQTRADGARGMLDQHRQDVQTADDQALELAREVGAAANLTTGRYAHSEMLQAKREILELATREEPRLQTALRLFLQLERTYSENKTLLAFSLNTTLKAAHPGAELPPVYPAAGTVRLEAEWLTGAAFLAEIDPDLTEHAVLGFDSPLNLGSFPALAAAMQQVNHTEKN